MSKVIGRIVWGLFGVLSLPGIPILAESQKLFAANEAQNILYLGIPNPITVAVDGISCSTLQVFGESNLIKLTDCKAVVIPTKKGVFLIEVFRKGKKLGEFPFRVLELPKPIIKIGILSSGEIRLKELISFGGLLARVPTNQMDLEVAIVRYSILILKTDDSLIKLSNVGAKFSEEVLQEFSRLGNGDRIVFSSIEGLLGTNKVTIDAREFTIAN